MQGNPAGSIDWLVQNDPGCAQRRIGYLTNAIYDAIYRKVEEFLSTDDA